MTYCALKLLKMYKDISILIHSQKLEMNENGNYILDENISNFLLIYKVISILCNKNTRTARVSYK